MRNILFWAAGLVSLICVGAASMASGEESEFSPYVDATGSITLPDPATVRAQWNHLGTWAVRGKDGVAEFHSVYTRHGTIEAYGRTGEFPDAAVLVKEVRKASGGTLTTGEVAWSGDQVLWFVMIKDGRGRFPDNPIWAEGWGWALFLAADPATNTATDFRGDCMACHEPARGTDWVYTRGYPDLRE